MPRRNTIEIIIKGEDRASSVLKKVGSVVSGLGKAAMIGLGAVGVAGAAAGAALLKFAIDAAPLAGIKAAFEGIAEASGESADKMLASLQKGSAGMITQRDLMAKYNLAAQLVGDTFANQLPDAMGYLSKVAAATGEDMGYMMDSLVRGVGRMSPMILDNLGIQVDMNAAIEEWAKVSGVASTSVLDNTKAIEKQKGAIAKLEDQLMIANMRQAEFTDKTKASTRAASEMRIQDLTSKLQDYRGELGNLVGAHGTTITSTEGLIESMTKAQKQEALMAQVMGKLAENTAAMPEVLGTAATEFAAFGTQIKDLKDGIGLGLQPALLALLVPLNDLIEKYGPRIIEWAKIAGTWLGEKVPEAIEWFGETWNKWWPIISAKISAAWGVIQPIFQTLGAWLGEKIPKAIEWLGKTWNEWWPIISAKISEVWGGVVQPILQVLREWLIEKVPVAIERLKALWTSFWPEAQKNITSFWDNIKPALEWVQDMFQRFYATYLPKLVEAWNILQRGWDDIVDLYNTLLKPALQDLWAALQPLWETLGVGEDTTFDVAGALGIFEGVLAKIVASGIIGLIEAAIIALTVVVRGLTLVFKIVRDWTIITRDAFNELRGALETIRDRVSRVRDIFWSMIAPFNEVRHWISVIIEKFNHLRSSLSNFQLPWWLRPGSPTPLETGLAGIEDMLSKVQGLAAKGLNFGEMPLVGAGIGAGAGAGLFGGGGGATTAINIVNNFGAGSVRSDEDILEIADAITQTLELRGVVPLL